MACLVQEQHKEFHCATYRKTGSCDYGDSCRYSHDIPVEGIDRGNARTTGEVQTLADT